MHASGPLPPPLTQAQVRPPEDARTHEEDNSPSHDSRPRREPSQGKQYFPADSQLATDTASPPGPSSANHQAEKYRVIALSKPPRADVVRYTASLWQGVTVTPL